MIGRVSLNITTIDLTDLPGDAAWGEEAVLFGSQGDEVITFEDLADKFGSVHTEINLMADHMSQRSYQD